LKLDGERLAAKPLLEELRMGRRRWSELKRGEKRLLEGAPLIDYLLDQSLALRNSDPEGMAEFAKAAKLVADRIHPRRYGRRILADLRARVWAILGNAYRVADKLSAAEAALGQAARSARRGTGSRALSALIEEVAAILYSDLRRFPESMAMLDRTIAYYSRRRDVQQIGRALISRGLITGYASEPELAVVFLTRGLRLIGPLGGGSALHLPAVHALALNLVEAGHCTVARVFLEKNERFYRRGGRLSKLRLHWLKGKIAHGLGELGRAEADFHVARLGFKRVRQNYDAALVSLDLALLYTKQGKRIATLHVVDEMIGTFRSLGIAREAIASLLLLRRSCDDGGAAPEVLAAQIRTIASLVAELQRHRARAR
jgi:tetratricopeptide (TPR) repeat protein